MLQLSFLASVASAYQEPVTLDIECALAGLGTQAQLDDLWEAIKVAPTISWIFGEHTVDYIVDYEGHMNCKYFLCAAKADEERRNYDLSKYISDRLQRLGGCDAPSKLAGVSRIGLWSTCEKCDVEDGCTPEDLTDIYATAPEVMEQIHYEYEVERHAYTEFDFFSHCYPYVCLAKRAQSGTSYVVNKYIAQTIDILGGCSNYKEDPCYDGCSTACSQFLSKFFGSWPAEAWASFGEHFRTLPAESEDKQELCDSFACLDKQLNNSDVARYVDEIKSSGCVQVQSNLRNLKGVQPRSKSALVRSMREIMLSGNLNSTKFLRARTHLSNHNLTMHV